MSEEFFIKHHFAAFEIGEKWSEIEFEKKSGTSNDDELNPVWEKEISKLFSKQGAYLPIHPATFNNKLSKIENHHLTDKFKFDEVNSGFRLYYDKNVDMFFIIACMAISKKNPHEHICLKGINAHIRNEFVIDRKDFNVGSSFNTKVSEWFEDIKSFCIKSVAEELDITAEIDKKIFINDNTGYIFSICPELEVFIPKSDATESYFDEFLASNYDIDQVNEKKNVYAKFSIAQSNKCHPQQDLIVSNVVFFGWRFSTLYGIENEKTLRILPVLIKLQNIYIIINLFYKTLISTLFNKVKYTDDYIKLSETLILFDKFVIFFENLKFEKDNFVVDLKPFQREIFQEIENYWSMNNDYGNIDRTLNICQTSLQRKLELKNNKVQQKQSDILFILAIIQIFSIISILSDYFGFITIRMNSYDLKNHVEGIYDVSNHYLVYLLFGTSSALIVFAYYDRFIEFIKDIKFFPFKKGNKKN